jgi:hypothetical protein
MKKVSRILTADLIVFKTEPLALGIFVSGIVPNRDFSNDQLTLREHGKIPADGIYDLDFMAEEPMSPTVDHPTLITSDYVR